MTGVQFELDTNDLGRGLDRLRKAVERDGKAGLTRAGETVMTAAKILTPVDTGTLRSSGRVGEPRKDGDSLVVDLTFGGAASAYALQVHEDLHARHPSGQAKYLEQPFREYMATGAIDIASALRGGLK